jgi:hypothetical protein
LSSNTILTKDGVSDGAGANNLVSQAGAVRTIGLFAAEHASLAPGGDPDATELIVLLCQAGMTLCALFRFLQYFVRDIKPLGFRHEGSFMLFIMVLSDLS